MPNEHIEAVVAGHLIARGEGILTDIRFFNTTGPVVAVDHYHMPLLDLISRPPPTVSSWLSLDTPVLQTFQIAPVGHVGAVRESGVVFGALAGWLQLGERFGRVRAAGATLVFTGVAPLAAVR